MSTTLMGGEFPAATAAGQKPDVLVFPLPEQGHINPGFALAKCLAANGLRVTFIMSTRQRKLATVTASPWWDSMISIDAISDGSEEKVENESVGGYMRRVRARFSKNLEEYLDKYDGLARPKAIVYDSTMPWVLDIAHKRGIRGASFFTQNCGVCSVYYHIRQKVVKYPYEECVVSLPSLPALEKKDLPYFDAFPDLEHSCMRFLVDQFENLEKVDWILFNTFYKLECEMVNWMANRWPIKTVGPTFSLVQKDKTLADNNTNHSISLFEPKQEAYAEWLDAKESSSVLYVSLGSVASIEKEQMEELASGLLLSNCYFLWIVRTSERGKLPENIVSTASEKGLIVDWCHQPSVLAHDALACFMTHCGWNSTLEALIHGVPLVVMPQFVDQQTNAKLIEDVWRFGIRVKAGDNGIVTREEIATCIEEMVGGDKGKEHKRNALKWKQLANEAVAAGGTSANNIEDFVSELMSS